MLFSLVISVFVVPLAGNSKSFATGSDEYTAEHIIDKVGSGDCFMAGLIYGNMNNHNEKETLEFATAAAVDKMFVMGDATTSSVEDILKRQSTARKKQIQ